MHFNKNYLLQTGIDQLCYYINESILPKPGFEDSEDHLIPRAMTHAAEELKKMLRQQQLVKLVVLLLLLILPPAAPRVPQIILQLQWKKQQRQ